MASSGSLNKKQWHNGGENHGVTGENGEINGNDSNGRINQRSIGSNGESQSIMA